MSESDLAATRRALHGVAELVLAGPQFRRSGTIRLRQSPGGFATVAAPDLRVDGAYLIAGTQRLPLSGTTIGALAGAAGVDVGEPGNYGDGSGAQPADEIDLDDAAVRALADVYAIGDQAMRRLAPSETPVLWPEHFDLGITVDDVNYGVSLGDAAVPEPYAYVGPHQRRQGSFWTQPFGAAVPVRDVDSVFAFFTEGQERARLDPPA